MFGRILITVLAFTCFGSLSARAQQSFTDAEYSFISGLYTYAPDLNLVIRDESKPVEIYQSKFVPTYDDISIKKAKRYLTGISDETITDFNDKNATVARLIDVFRLPGKVRLVSHDDVFRLFPARQDPYKGWKAFRKNFGVDFYQRFSRVGFNKAHDQALIFAAYNSECFSDGTYTLYVKTNGAWKKKKSFVVWRNEDS